MLHLIGHNTYSSMTSSNTEEASFMMHMSMVVGQLVMCVGNACTTQDI
jgi:hypothetical protein